MEAERRRSGGGAEAERRRSGGAAGAQRRRKRWLPPLRIVLATLYSILSFRKPPIRGSVTNFVVYFW